MANLPRGSRPMVLPAAPFALADAVACAALVNIAYQQYAQWVKKGCPSKANFHWSTPTGRFYYSAPLFWSYAVYDEPFGFVAVNTQTSDAYLVFRGTMSDADDAADLLTDQVPYKFAPGYGQVHLGFHDIYEQLQPQVHAAIAAAVPVLAPFKRFFFTGHSLGSGLSSLAVPDVIANVPIKPAIPRLHHNFASPRVGDPQFAYMMNNNSVPTYRVVNTEDVIPDLPGAIWETGLGAKILYKHIGTPVDFTAQYDSDGDNHSLNVAYQYAIAHPTDPEGPLRIPPIGQARLPGVRLDSEGDVMQLPEVG